MDLVMKEEREEKEEATGGRWWQENLRQMGHFVKGGWSGLEEGGVSGVAGLVEKEEKLVLVEWSWERSEERKPGRGMVSVGEEGSGEGEEALEGEVG